MNHWCCVSESEDMQHWNLRLQNWCQQWAPHGILSLWQHLFRVTHSNSRNLIVVASRQILLSHSIVWINYSSLNQWSAWAFRHNDAGSQVTSWKEPWGHMRLITVRGQCTQHYVTCEQLMSMAVGILMNSVSVMTMTDEQSVVNLWLCRASNPFCWNAKGDLCVSPFLISILSVLLQEVCQKGHPGNHVETGMALTNDTDGLDHDY